ncbi:NUDIX hydrolase [Halochromatium roseum]|uniref:NUDIX hydrolase n=1 Tax=Halochromatium roseum TaxID=391920 RepID=UPI0019136AB3|nr:NUDIX hydrolase [Halochromatium roseum]
MSDWQRLREIVRIDSDWVRLIAERWLCDKGQELEYWRVEKVDSVIVLPLYRQQLLCVRASFRPGIQRATLDFPGGRLPAGQQPLELAPLLLERELGVTPTALQRTEPLNQAPWVINSAFSNQGLWGIVAEIDPDHPLLATHIGQRAPPPSPACASCCKRSIACNAARCCWNGRARRGACRWIERRPNPRLPKPSGHRLGCGR